MLVEIKRVQPGIYAISYDTGRTMATEIGTKYTFGYRVFCCREGREISYWHDVPLYNKPNNGKYNFVCEIPRNTRAKMEVTLDEANTPIKQDVKNGKLRFYDEKIPWNYGMLPRTWEDPAHAWPSLGPDFQLPGDGDPLDVIEISGMRCRIGHVYEVKVLGAYALIDEGEVDWKILAIRTDYANANANANANDISDVQDVDTHMPGELRRIKEWFRDYKYKTGRVKNTYGLGGVPQNAAYARDVIAAGHDMYLHRSTL